MLTDLSPIVQKAAAELLGVFMKGLSQKLKIIAPIGITLLTLMGFQNCSGVNFEQAPIEQASKSL